jgi:hypothetical protein
VRERCLWQRRGAGSGASGGRLAWSGETDRSNAAGPRVESAVLHRRVGTADLPHRLAPLVEPRCGRALDRVPRPRKAHVHVSVVPALPQTPWPQLHPPLAARTDTVARLWRRVRDRPVASVAADGPGSRVGRRGALRSDAVRSTLLSPAPCACCRSANCRDLRFRHVVRGLAGAVPGERVALGEPPVPSGKQRQRRGR